MNLRGTDKGSWASWAVNGAKKIRVKNLYHIEIKRPNSRRQLK